MQPENQRSKGYGPGECSAPGEGGQCSVGASPAEEMPGGSDSMASICESGRLPARFENLRHSAIH